MLCLTQFLGAQTGFLCRGLSSVVTRIDQTPKHFGFELRVNQSHDLLASLLLSASPQNQDKSTSSYV